jgi:vacuolar-type H+-ATPase subunit I/STV1
MQADYTRKTQEIATLRARAEELEFLDALRQDPDTQRAVFEQLQELLTESETEVQRGRRPTEPPLERQVRELREAHEAREAQELPSAIVTHIEQLQKDAGVELDEHDLRQVFAAATENGVGQSDREAAFKAHVDA